MFSVAVCDDIVRELNHVYSLLEEYAAEKQGYSFQVSRYASADDLLAAIQSGQCFQIYLLDIIMPGQNGIELGKSIRRHDRDAVIIYLTSSPDYALSSYAVGAMQYLLKPVRRESLFEALDKALSILETINGKSLVVKTKMGIEALRFHAISHVEYVGHGIRCFLRDGSVVSSMTIRESFNSIAGKLTEDPRFVRPHTSFLVNLSQVRTIGLRDFEMMTGAAVPISRKNYIAIKRQYMDYLLNGGDQHVIAIGAPGGEHCGRDCLPEPIPPAKIHAKKD